MMMEKQNKAPDTASPVMSSGKKGKNIIEQKEFWAKKQHTFCIRLTQATTVSNFVQQYHRLIAAAYNMYVML